MPSASRSVSPGRTLYTHGSLTRRQMLAMQPPDSAYDSEDEGGATGDQLDESDRFLDGKPSRRGGSPGRVRTQCSGSFPAPARCPPARRRRTDGAPTTKTRAPGKASCGCGWRRARRLYLPPVSRLRGRFGGADARHAPHPQAAYKEEPAAQ
jgi:hypothetical protein